MKSKNWRTSTIGIIGLGNIGLQLADDCSRLGMTIIYSNRHSREDLPYEYVSEDELLARADCVVLACPLTEETRHLIGREALGKMKDGMVLVNVCEL